MFNRLRLLSKGMAIGIGNIIPGISGGTVAVILGIYNTLLESLSTLLSGESLVLLKQLLINRADLNKAHLALCKTAFFFLLQVGIGAILGIFLFSKGIASALEFYPQPTLFFFMGLIIGSLPALYRSQPAFNFSLSHAVGGALGLFIMVLLNFFPESHEFAQQNIEQLTPSMIGYLVVSGAIAAGTMVIPGISGSLMLLILGSYYLILSAVSDMNLPVLLWVALGAGLGLILFTKLITFCLRRYPIFSAYFIMGLIIGSLLKLWPGFTLGTESYIAASIGVLGVFVGNRLG